ncbi:UDP-N-acetylmuramoyl-L-alanyl-D-glutamate--2,6-diaminopimelate ligase [Bifidobacterium leontopitheci]|uniref:UDP-N-acetylmuramoylalanyl-D-glutamate--2, 6-diaminopimelate ligase n=1 Tax=Bifidobacterium leontopitheci TaxID=2650774 RepID=A0A6I1GPY6_9BIFI|nr:UDP-N-acetylmuramoyl-L-alanyl-D-glutamate--2,6-diaminopimelate ligase [Bifidobacterium leontopitheci]KAB7791347.1 UDP-N-acetylmuramoylalanyl-D-glutamate--2, 6-diaminopimelate ligase [Bifidobacterium leontopitheci]
MTITLASAARLLTRHGLLREIIRDGVWTLDPSGLGDDIECSSITYDTRKVTEGALLCCKGRFKAEYLHGIDGQGLAAYVAETDFSAETKAVGLIVNDVRRAMSLLSAEFYGRPQDELTVIGITGTKGKTTTAYFTQAILNAASDGKCALFSSVDNCLDGHTYVESDLTTPESMDAFRMMREAADNGMKYLVMEVSSQAYKVERVYGLTFDVGAFLNISPDHISPIEHPTFEDYLYCKRQIVRNSRRLVLGADCAHADLIRQDAAAAEVPVTTFALRNDGADETAAQSADLVATRASADHSAYRMTAEGAALGTLSLSLDGDFNYANAAAALAIAQAAGVDVTDAKVLQAMEPVRIAGRMEQFHDPQSDTIAIVDYAHNYASVTALLDFVDERFGSRDPRITLVTGSAGNKAYDRRKEIVEAAQNRIANFIFTAEDTDTEPFIDICMEMQGYITNDAVTSTVISDRSTAIMNAIYDARAHKDRFNVLLIIGKGNERWIKDRNKHVPFEGDDHVVERMFA